MHATVKVLQVEFRSIKTEEFFMKTLDSGARGGITLIPGGGGGLRYPGGGEGV